GWSHDQLNPSEQRFLRRLAVFAGSFSVEDIQGAISLGNSESSARALVLVSRLVDKSLVVAGEGRVHLLEAIREDAYRRLAECGELGACNRGDSRYMQRLASSREPGRLAQWLTSIDEVLPDLRSALAWSMEHDLALALKIATAVFPYWGLRGRITEARHSLD